MPYLMMLAGFWGLLATGLVGRQLQLGSISRGVCWALAYALGASTFGFVVAFTTDATPSWAIAAWIWSCSAVMIAGWLWLQAYQFAWEQREITFENRYQELTQELEANGKRLDRVSHGAGVGVWELDLKTNTFWANRQSYELFQFPMDPANPIRFEQFASRLHSDDHDRFMTAYQLHLSERVQFHQTYRVVLPDGNYRWFESVACAEWNEEGTPIYMSGTTADVTQKIRYQEDFQAVEFRYQQLADYSPDVYWFCDVDQTHTYYISRAAERITGRTLEDLKSKPGTFVSSVHPEDQERIRAAFFGLAQAGSYVQEYRMVHRDGSVRWLLDRGYLIRDESGNPVRLAGIAQDVTARKLLEQGLHETNLRLERLLNEIQTWIAVLDPDGRIKWINQLPLKVYGLEEAQVLGLRLPEGPWVEDLPESKQLLNSLIQQMAGRTTIRQDVTVRLPDGQKAIFDAIISPRLDEKGQLVEVLASGFNVTQRRESELLLKHTLERLEEAQSLAGLGWWTLDPKANVFALSNELERILGFRPDPAKNDLAELVERVAAPEYRELLTKILGQLLSKSVSVEFEYQIQQPSGRRLWALSRASSFVDETGNVTLIKGTTQDITARKEAELQLIRQTRLFERVAEAHPDAIYVYDLVQQRNVYMNREVATILGYTTEQISAFGELLMAQLMYPDDFSLVAEHHARCRDLAEGEIGEVEYRMRRQDGSIRWLYSRDVAFARGSDGRVTQILGVAKDVTEQRLSELALRRSEERFRLATEAVNGLVYEFDIKNNTVYRSNRLKNLIGYSPDEAPASAEWWMEQIHPDDAQRLLAGEAYANINVPSKAIEYRVRHRDGHWVDVLDFQMFVHDDQGQPIRCIGCTTDITERKRSEAALREGQRRLTTAEEIGRIGSWELDLRTGQAQWSPNMFRMLGLVPGEEITDSQAFTDQFVHPDDREWITKQWTESMTKSLPFNIEFRLCPKGGTVITVLGRFKPAVDENGQLVRWSGTIQDVSDQKIQAELLAKQAQELIQSNEELQRFAYVASHDLQEPLRMVRSYLNLIQMKYQGQLDEKADKYIRYAVDGADRMKQLIEDLLAYSRVQSHVLKREWIDLNQLMQTVLTNLEPTIREKNAVIHLDTLPSVWVDSTQLLQVFQNLINNALKFCDLAPEIQIRAQNDSSAWVFSIKDNGIGIAPEHQERIFQMFQRLHSIGKYPGTGIGLSVCQRVIERHGGKLWVTSQPGAGSTFSFSLPHQPGG